MRLPQMKLQQSSWLLRLRVWPRYGRQKGVSGSQPATLGRFLNLQNPTSWLGSNPGGRFNKEIPSYQYRNSHCGDKTIVRSSYLHNGISYTGNMTSLYWIRTLVIWITLLPYGMTRKRSHCHPALWILNNVKVQPSRLNVSDQYPNLGVSPDHLIEEDTVL